MAAGEMTATSAGVLPASLACLRPVVVDDLVRVGNPNDGGYVLPERAIGPAGCLLSFGVNDDWTFEQDFHRRNPGCLIHAYDHTVNRRHFYRRAKMDFKRCLQLKRGAYDRFKKSREIYRDYREFFSSNRVHFSERIFDRLDGENDATMEKVFARVAGDFKVVVKMDIEGSEYRVIRPLLQYQDRVDLLIVEFHDSGPLRLTFLDCLRQVSERYQIVHVHGNNGGGAAADGLPDILEITFLSRRFNVPPVYRDELPLKGLDAPNLLHRPDFHLRFQSA